MLADLVGSYLDSFEGREREFDSPFMALLRAHGYYDIRFTHGGVEFGKDFIAKCDEAGVRYQYVFQTKAGDLNLPQWRDARLQIDELRRNALSHPAFDTKLPRRAVFVTTGRLNSPARVEAQQYANYIEQERETPFTLWERETLVEMMSVSPESGVAGDVQGALLKLLGEIEIGEARELNIEQFSRRWLASAGQMRHLWRAALEAGIIANLLRRHNRLDLACITALCLMRAAWASTHGTEPADGIGGEVAELGRDMFRYYAREVWSDCDDEILLPARVFYPQNPLVAFITYPVKCSKLIEILGLFGLLELTNDGSLVDAIAAYLVRFFDAQPGAMHPISDRYAVSLAPPLLLLAVTGRGNKASFILKEITRWVADRYDKEGLGLASPYADPAEEVTRLLGTPMAHITINRRVESYLAAMVLDLAAVLEEKEIYELAVNEFRAVGALPSITNTGDDVDQYMIGGDGVTRELNAPYQLQWNSTNEWQVAPHHSRQNEPRYLERIGFAWDQLALSSVLRDRHFIHVYRGVIERVGSNAHASSK